MKKITINEEECIGCGSCAQIDEKHFEIKNGKSTVKEQYNEEDKDLIEEVINSCPVGAIEITEEDK